MKCLNMSWVSALPMCQEISMVMAGEAYEINKFKMGHTVVPYFQPVAASYFPKSSMHYFKNLKVWYNILQNYVL